MQPESQITATYSTATTYFDAIEARGGIVERITKDEIPKMADPPVLAISGRLFTEDDEWLVMVSAHLDESTASRVAAWALGHHEHSEEVAVLLRGDREAAAFGCDDVAACRTRGAAIVSDEAAS